MLLCWQFFHNLPIDEFQQAIPIFWQAGKLLKFLNCIEALFLKCDNVSWISTIRFDFIIRPKQTVNGCS
jgi:hypothetical protein